MRVRDLRQYIESIPGSSYNISELGTHREPFLTYMGGHYQSVEQVKKFIESSSSFATNAEEQLFYEFVQNAYDAHADSLFFFADERYLVVLNNGTPFYTDFDLQSDNKKSGQLFNFLAKGKSDKPGDDEQMGQFGQGSKLLYTLITDVSETGEYTDAELLVDAIYNKQKGPYLISWDSQEQLTNLLYGDKTWELAQADDFKNNILFAKILYSYFPVAPGQEPRLFENHEAVHIVNVFDKLVNPRRNLQFLNSGTSLIIPLGKGKYDLIHSSSNLAKVRTRLGGFSALTANQSDRNGTKLKHIYVLGQEIEQTEVKSVRWEKRQGAKTYKYHVAFNPKFAQEGYVNIFKGLPILSTKYNVGFVVDSQCFQTDDSRQRLSNPETSGKQLRDIFEELIKRLNRMKTSDPTTFDWIYDSILASRIAQNEDSAFLLQPFNEVIKPFLADNIRTNQGDYCKSSQVFLQGYDYGFDIPLARLGITSKKWVDRTIEESLDYIGIHLGKMKLHKVISEANTDAFQKWVKEMPDTDYQLYQDICWEYVQRGIYTTTALFRSNKQSLYSLEELKSDSPVYYGYKSRIFNGLECIEVPVKGSPTPDYFSVLLHKIVKNIETYRKSNLLKDTVSSLLRYIVQECPSLKSDVLNKVYLFDNRLGDRCSLSQLFVDVPDGSTLFDVFQVKGYLPESIKSSRWMISAKDNPQGTWYWVVNNISSILKVPEWETYAHEYLSDIKNLYKSLPPTPTTPLITNLYIDDKGRATTDVFAMVNVPTSFSEYDYHLIQSIFPTESLLPYEYYKDLNDKPFKLSMISVDDMIEDGLCVNLDKLAVLSKHVSHLLNKYYIKAQGGKYFLYSINKGRNYINELDATMTGILENAGFHFIPKEVHSAFSHKELSDYDISNNEALVQSIVINAGDDALLSILPLVENCKDAILRTYFQRLTTINIDYKLSESSYEWGVITLAVKHRFNTDFVDVVFAKIRHKGRPLEDKIVNDVVKVGLNQYQLYDLDTNYMHSNQHIESFMNCLPSPRDIDLFKREFYHGKEYDVEAATVYNRIHSLALTLEQLHFCIDYARQFQIRDTHFSTDASVTITQVMDMVEANKLNGFDKYYTLQGFNASQQVFADSDLLLAKEQLPNELKSWLDRHTNSTSWFSDIRTNREVCIGVREAIRDQKEYTGSLNVFAVDNFKTHDTIEWLLARSIVCSSKSWEHRLLTEIIQKLPESFTVMPFFKYTGDTMKDTDGNAIYALLSFCTYVNGKPFLKSNERTFVETLHVNSQLRQFIVKSDIYENPPLDTLRKHHLHNSPRWEVNNGVASGKYEELSYRKYIEWKNDKASEGVTIWTSRSPVGVTLSVSDENQNVLFSIKRTDAEYGYSSSSKQVVVQWPNKDNLSKIETVTKFSKNIYWFKDPLIAFLKMYVNETDELQKLADEKGIEMDDLVEMVRNTLSGQTMGTKVLNAIHEAPDTLNSIMRNMDESTLKKVSDNAPLVKSILEEFSANDLEWMASLSNETLGLLKKLSASDIEKMIAHGADLGYYINKENKSVSLEDAEMLNDFAEALDYNNTEELVSQLDAIKYVCKHFDKSGWNKFAKNAKNVAEIVEKFDDEELKQIAENEQNLKDFLSELEEEQNGADRDSSVSEIIGYIGELIYEQYLIKQRIQYYFSANNGIMQYDFIIYPNNSARVIYIDVKTTRNTLSDGHAPMYIHKSQDEFLRNNPGVTYRFVRISLHDLEGELESEYERFLNQYGNVDPRTSSELKKECQDLAKRFWSQASINDFQESVPEYRIEYVSH